MTCRLDLIPAAKKSTKRVEVIFHEIAEKIRVSLVKICIDNGLSERTADQLALSKQQTENKRK